MKTWKTAFVAGAITASVFIAANAEQAGPPAPPPMMVGTLEVGQATPAPLQFSRSVTLDAQPDAVFAHIANAQNWVDLIDPVTAVETDGAGQKGDTRRFTMQDGRTFVDVIRANHKPSASKPGVYAWSAAPGNPYGLEEHLSALEFRPSDDGGTVLSFYVFFASPDAQKANMMAQGLGKSVDHMLGNVVRTFGGEERGSAQGTQRVTLTQQRTINATPQQAWRVVAEQWGQVDRWASTVAHSELTGKLGVGAVRSCSVPGTPGFKETLLTYNPDEMSLSYQPTEGMPPFVKKAVGTWKISPEDGNRVTVDIAVVLDIAEGTPLPVVGMVKHQFGQLVDVTGDDVKYFLENGKPHPRKLMAASGM
ncbi:MAG: SRPBCC family protein [Planctomycetota bacterium]